jgi:tetratricopeptide (TPR) repeat protein
MKKNSKLIFIAIFLLILTGNLYADDFENLEKKIKNAKPNVEKVSLYAEIGEIVARNTALDNSKLRYILQGIKLADELEDNKNKVTLLNLMGVAKRNRGKFDEARKFHLKALDVARSNNLRKEEVAALNNLGVVWRRMDQLKQAAQYHNEALKIATKIGDTAAIAISCNGLGNINLTLKNMK